MILDLNDQEMRDILSLIETEKEWNQDWRESYRSLDSIQRKVQVIIGP